MSYKYILYLYTCYINNVELCVQKGNMNNIGPSVGRVYLFIYNK